MTAVTREEIMAKRPPRKMPGRRKGSKNPKAGRPKGSKNERSRILLRELEKYGKFSIAKELLEIYGYNKSVLGPMVVKMAENLDNNLPATTGFSKDEIVLFNTLNKQTINLLVKMLAYLYPKLASLSLETGVSDKVVFNINTVGNLPVPKKDQRQLIDVTPKEGE